MSMKIEAACGCNIGRIRSNNEDNLYFNGLILEEKNIGLKDIVRKKFHIDSKPFFCVFDGMGGEEAGETASYIAALTVKERFGSFMKQMRFPQKFLENICLEMNDAVCLEAASLGCRRMGSTIVSLLFVPDGVYICNIGDSRAFRFRNNELVQLSKDHTDFELLSLNENSKRKPRLTQHLGIFPDELILEPFIDKTHFEKGDQYLLCSDGLTDMLTNVEISEIMQNHKNTRQCVKHLSDKAIENGGKDNITVIICKVI